MKLRGVNMHHDLGALGAAVNYRAIERQVQILKGMGVNAIRTSHNPPAPELLDIADRLGVLVLDEAFDTWEQTQDHERLRPATSATWAQRDIQAMVRRDRNHPSVILWSIGNEVGGSTTATATKLKNWVLALDTTRPVTWASNKMGGPHVSEGDDRNVAKLLDVVGLQLRALRRRLRRRPLRPPDLEDARQRELGGRAQPRHLPHARGHGHQGDLDVDGGPAVLVLRQRGGRVRRQRADLVQLREHPRLRRRFVHLDGLRLHRRADAVLVVAVQELVLRRHRHRRVPEGHLLLLQEPLDDRADGPHPAALELDAPARTSRSSSTATATASSCS